MNPSRRLASRMAGLALALVGTGLPAAAAPSPAGVAVLVHGSAVVEDAQGRRPLRYRDAVFAGDTVVSGADALVQLQMNDGALLSLRPQTVLVVAGYPARGLQHTSAATPGIVLRLVKGGLRTVTGAVQAIGPRRRDDYRLETPIATIGIRGTDYMAAVCAGDCAATADGLYVGVFDGAVELANAAGRVTLERGEYAHVADARSAPRRQAQRPVALDRSAPVREAGTVTGFATDAAHTDAPAPAPANDVPPAAALDSGAAAPAATSAELSAQTARYARAFAAALPDEPSQTGTGAASALRFDAQGGLRSLTLNDASGQRDLDIGSATNQDLGADAATGLRWGRWSGGTVAVTGVSGTTALDLSQHSLHWIVGPEFDAPPVLPRSGFAAFDLIGATAPTDQDGQRGVLGHADLVADFDRQVVFSSLDLRLDGDHWLAWGIAALDGSPQFSGHYDHVQVNLLGRGSGDFSGFFAGAGTVPAAAGLSYQLHYGGTEVSGVAAFARGDHHGGTGGP
ncbi:FecR domain-containing protein [Fontimonas sp. SYSU GA230001]|uniref:FecR family protein n=1 Tax=Fontimonas sp. SYSU GA230001 TaxID=3142450 RepID=UPI0032B4907C